MKRKVISKIKQSFPFVVLLFFFVVGGILFKYTSFVYADTTLTDTMETYTYSNITDIDLGEYQPYMSVGERQILTITLLPQTITAQNVIYKSDDESIASINAIGRITAHSAGKTKITLSCQNITRSFDLTVREIETVTKSKIKVTDIEIADFKEELEVDKTVNLTATVIPNNATDSKITYSTSNSSIATVSSTGVVKGIASGNVEIIMTADDFTKKIPLIVKTTTTAIELNTNYLVLKQGNSFQICGNVTPIQAEQTLTYKSADEKIAIISSYGNITACGIGSTTVLVSNGDITNAVTVIVNTFDEIEGNPNTNIETPINITTVQESSFIHALSQNNVLQISSEEYPVITSIMLKNLYQSKKKLIIQGSNYIMKLNGTDIVNCNNELSTAITFIDIEKHKEFTLNENQNLPGLISLQIDSVNDYRYLYLYNTTKEKFEKITVGDIKNIKIDIAGKYILSTGKLYKISISFVLILGFIFVVIGLITTYIVVKKKYWFW